MSGTRLAYKAEHGVDLHSEAIVAAAVTHAGRPDLASAPLTLTVTAANLTLVGSAATVTKR